MESRANYAAIGLFVLVMLMTGLGFLYWLTNAGEQARRAAVRVVFSGAVTGLNTGSAVLFNGIRIGEVAELQLDPQDPNTVIAIVNVDRTKPIKTDTRAILSYQGLTGVANLQLEGGSRNAPLLLDSVRPEDGMPTIHADISPFQDILESAKNVLQKADSAMSAIDEFVSENGPAFNRTVNNVETFSRALAENAPAIDDALASVGEVADSLGSLAESVRGSATRVEEILGAVDPARVEQLVGNVTEASDRLNRVLERAEQVAGGIDPATVNQAVQNVADAAGALRETIDQAKGVVGAVDPAEVEALVGSLRRTSDDLGAAARRAQEVVAAVDPAKVGGIVDQVDVTTRNLADVSSTVGGAVTTARDALARVGEVVGAVDPAKVRGTVDDVAAFADTLSGYKPQIDGILADTRSASESLRRLGGTIDERNRDVGIIITDARNLVAQLNGIAARTDGILETIGGFVEGGDSQGLVAEASATLKSIRDVADNLNGQIGPISADVSKFTSRGLGSFTALAEDGRRALGRLDRVLSGIEQNPQQFLFGGQGVPEYNPRRR